MVGVQNVYGAHGESAYLHHDLETEMTLGMNYGAFKFARTGAVSYSDYSLHTATPLHKVGDETQILLAANGDLYAIIKSGTGTGTTEVHVLSAASGYQEFSWEAGTALAETDASWEFQLADNDDLFAIKRTGTGTQSTEIHVLSADSGYQDYSLETGTGLTESPADKVDFQLAQNRDLVAIMKNKTGSGMSEFHRLVH